MNFLPKKDKETVNKMAEIRRWDGVIVTYKTVTVHLSSETSTEYEDIEKIEYICYEDFNSLSFRDNLKDTQKTFDQVQWVNNGQVLPIYMVFCSICQNVLDIHTEYCCSSHQIKISPSDRLGILKIMTKQISLDQTLCSFMTVHALHYFNLTDNDKRTLLDLGRKHISLFATTPAGIMLQSELKETT